MNSGAPGTGCSSWTSTPSMSMSHESICACATVRSLGEARSLKNDCANLPQIAKDSLSGEGRNCPSSGSIHREPEIGTTDGGSRVGAARTERGGRPGRSPGEARVSALLARHGPALMRVARQASMCHDDAMDALQRALEIYVRRLEHVDVATEAAWLKVVIRHEAYAIRRSRGDCVTTPDF